MIPSPKIFTGRKALIWFVGFFLVVFAANGIMSYIAVNTWGGLETNDAYRKGLFYNQEIAAASAQKKSAWQISLAHSPESPQGDRLDVVITWPESDLPPAKVSAMISRAVTNKYDQTITFTRTENNIYTAPVTLPLAGQWDIDIRVARPEGPVYQLQKSIFVSPDKESITNK